ncbi:TIGR04222 domain-containing membrane protein [Streptomyces sp. NPDC059248]|uniref:TIGR04222 domain-containing membrane protein n=1 Tax=Streptomyces sp. NPDC059248 TaxID=3346791 RepID=UPI003687A83A
MSTVTEALLIDAFILTATVSLIVAACVVRRRATDPLRSDPELYEVAFLTGGPARVVDTAVAEMIGAGQLRIAATGFVTATGVAPADPIQQAVLTALRNAESGALSEVRREVALSPVVQEIGDRLARAGLLVGPVRTRRNVRRWAITQMILLLAAIPAVVLRTVFGYDGGIPLAAMVVPLIIPSVLVTAVVMAALHRHTTTKGRQAVNSYIRNCYPSHHPGSDVALEGPRSASDNQTRAVLLAAAAVPIVAPVYSDGGVTVTGVWCGSSAGGDSSYGGGSGSSSCGGGGGGGGGGSSCGGGGGSSCGGGGSSCGGGGGSSCGGGGGC